MKFKVGHGDAVRTARAAEQGIHARHAGVEDWSELLRKSIVPYALQDHFAKADSAFRIGSIQHQVTLENATVTRQSLVLWKVDIEHGGKFLLRANKTELLEHTFNRTLAAQAKFYDSIETLDIRTKVHCEFYGMLAMNTKHGNAMSVAADGRVWRGLRRLGDP